LFKVGSAYIVPKDITIDDNTLFNKLIQCLNSSPLVVKTYTLSPTGKPRALNVFCFSRLMDTKTTKLIRLSFLPYIICKIHLPKKNQEIGMTWESFATSENIDWTEKFDVVYDGSIFLVSREIDFSKRFHPGSEDIREVFFSILKKEKTWNLKSVAPVPLRENIILVFLVENNETAKIIGRNLFRKPGDLIFFLPESVLRKVDQFQVDFLSQISFDLALFYDTVCELNEVNTYREELEKIHIELKSMVDKLQKLHFYNFLAYHKALKQLENLISKHFSYIVNYGLALNALEGTIGKLKEQLKQNFWLKHLQLQLLEELEHKKIDVDALTKCTNHIKEIAQRSYTNRITLLATILTIIGSIIGSLVIDYVRSVL
jgi:hypothetical protein